MEKVKVDYEKNGKLLTPLEALEQSAQALNSFKGKLNQIDGYNCEICNNNGTITKVDSEKMTLFSVPCSCMKTRKTIRNLKNCGINYETLKQAKFDNYNATEDWQKGLLNKVKEYALDFGNHKWLYVGGQTGAGKTMLMTALFKYLIIKKEQTGYYLLWNTESKILISQAKRDKDGYQNRIYELENCDVLYIDDFLKLGNVYSNDELSLAYEIINTRYVNNKITIITSEITKNLLEEKDAAIFGRIYEKTDYDKYFLDVIGEEKNYRTKGI